MQKKVNWPRNRLLLKNLQFLPNHYETLGKYSAHGQILLPEYELDQVKTEDFLLLSVQNYECEFTYMFKVPQAQI